MKDYDTAGAAEHIAKTHNIHEAAICSEEAAEHYGLKILRKNINDVADNYTLFLVFSCKKSVCTLKQYVVTSIIFEVNNTPKALHNAIGCFANQNINIIKLESYIPNVIDSNSASFFMTFSGNISDISTAIALEHMANFTNKIHVFGSYEQNHIVL